MIEHKINVFNFEIDLARMVGIATLPRRLRLSMYEHVEILKLYRPKRLLRFNLYKIIKEISYRTIALTDVGVMRDGSSMDYVRQRKKWVTAIAFIYLIGCIGYISYFTFKAKDNVLAWHMWAASQRRLRAHAAS